jgi:anaerobic selenocysteine-containing dehydrogenase
VIERALSDAEQLIDGNGAVQMFAVTCLPTVTGAWAHEGGGAHYSNHGMLPLDLTMIEGLDVADPATRILDQSRIGPVLMGDKRDLGDGPPVTALLVQNTNPMVVAPESGLVRQGFRRDDLFTCVHEQFMTETAAMADIVLPATMFMEHDDLYYGGGHQHISVGPKLIDPPGECRTNHEVLQGLGRRLKVNHPGFEMTPRELIDLLTPDVLVKGGDYKPDQVVGRDTVERAGGKVVIVPLVPGYSSSGVLSALRRG